MELFAVVILSFDRSLLLWLLILFCSREFGQLALDILEKAFKQNENGHEVADLWTEKLEQFNVLKISSVCGPSAFCVSYLYTDAADWYVDGTSEDAEELLA